MLKRKFFLVLVLMFSILFLFGCSQTLDNGYSGGYPTQEEGEYNKKLIENDFTETDTSTSSLATTGCITTVKTSTSSTSTTSTVTSVQTVATTEATTTIVTDIPAEPPVTEMIIPEDTLVIKEVIIPLTYGIPTQEMVDNSDVVCDNGEISGINTFIMGHSYKSFEILDSVTEGEIFAINNQGELKYYEVQRSERAYLNEEDTDVYFCCDNSEILYNNYGYPAVILITCDKQDPYQYRWIVIAKEV